jgi:hypothetical protein
MSAGTIHPLFVHGAFVWKVALAAAPLIGVLVALLGARLLLSRRAARARRRLGPIESKLDIRPGAKVTLRGTLAAAEKPPAGRRLLAITSLTTDVPTPNPFASSASLSPLALRVGSTEVPLAGEIEIMAGSLETPTRMSAATAQGIFPSCPCPRAPRSVRGSLSAPSPRAMKSWLGAASSESKQARGAPATGDRPSASASSPRPSRSGS